MKRRWNPEDEIEIIVMLDDTNTPTTTRDESLVLYEDGSGTRDGKPIVWWREHGVYCNYWMRPGLCSSCESHPEWPRMGELRKKWPIKNDDSECIEAEVAEKWPDAQQRT